MSPSRARFGLVEKSEQSEKRWGKRAMKVEVVVMVDSMEGKESSEGERKGERERDREVVFWRYVDYYAREG